MAAAAQSLDTSKLLTVPQNDPLANLLNLLATPPKTVTTTGAGTAALQQTTAQLQNLSTPTGAQAQIRQIFDVGNRQYMPGIATTINNSGARGGSSAYQALQEGNLQAMLSGQASTMLNNNANSAATAARDLSSTTFQQTSQNTTKALLQNVLTGSLASGGSALIKPLLDSMKAKMTGATAASTAGVAGSSGVAGTAGVTNSVASDTASSLAGTTAGTTAGTSTAAAAAPYASSAASDSAMIGETNTAANSGATASTAAGDVLNSSSGSATAGSTLATGIESAGVGYAGGQIAKSLGASQDVQVAAAATAAYFSPEIISFLAALF
jgi:trimeric autotransporter adhesin